MSEPNGINDRQGAARNTITHLVLAPLFTASLAVAIYMTIVHWHENPVLYLWLTALSTGLILLNAQNRLYALRLQDRLIRLEESLRIAASLPEADRQTAKALSTSQLIGLRFASDEELPALALRAAREGLTQKQIKEAIVRWRRDDTRV